MGKRFLLCIFLLASSFKWIKSEALEADRQFLDCILSNKFTNSTVTYVIDNAKYEIRIISNPNHELIWGIEMDAPIDWPLIIASENDIPRSVEKYITEQVPESLLKGQDCLIDLSFTRLFSDAAYATMQPIAIAEKIDDPRFDARIKEFFSSDKWSNQIFHYRLDGTWYHVRLIHNPQVLYRYATRQFFLSGEEDPCELRITWNDKYGIITDKKAPQKLIDHLSQLVPASWWDWYNNFTIYNGTLVEHIEYQYSYYFTSTTTWSLIPWFEFLEDL